MSKLAKKYVLCSSHRTPDLAEKREAEIKAAGGDVFLSKITKAPIWILHVKESQKKQFCKRYQ